MTEEQMYEVKDGVLHTSSEMLMDYDLQFDEACNELLDSDETELVVDLTASNYINSTYVGIIAAAFFQARARNKTLTLRASSAVANVLRAAGFEEFIPIEEVA